MIQTQKDTQADTFIPSISKYGVQNFKNKKTSSNGEILDILLQKIFNRYVEVGIDGGTSPLYGVKNLNS